MKPCRYLYKLKAELALSTREYGVPAGEGRRVPPQYALTKERVVYLQPADNYLVPKTGYNAPPITLL